MFSVQLYYHSNIHDNRTISIYSEKADSTKRNHGYHTHLSKKAVRSCRLFVQRLKFSNNRDKKSLYRYIYRSVTFDLQLEVDTMRTLKFIALVCAVLAVCQANSLTRNDAHNIFNCPKPEEA